MYVGCNYKSTAQVAKPISIRTGGSYHHEGEYLHVDCNGYQYKDHAITARPYDYPTGGYPRYAWVSTGWFQPFTYPSWRVWHCRDRCVCIPVAFRLRARPLHAHPCLLPDPRSCLAVRSSVVHPSAYHPRPHNRARA